MPFSRLPASPANSRPSPSPLSSCGATATSNRDIYAPRSHQDALLAAIPHARLSVYEGAGHALHWEDPAAFAAEISASLTERTTGR
jgi:hypothetical protein